MDMSGTRKTQTEKSDSWKNVLNILDYCAIVFGITCGIAIFLSSSPLIFMFFGFIPPLYLGSRAFIVIKKRVSNKETINPLKNKTSLIKWIELVLNIAGFVGKFQWRYHNLEIFKVIFRFQATQLE